MVLQNINLSEDEIGRPPFGSNDLSSIGYIVYAVSSVYFKRTLILYVHWTCKYLISGSFAFYLVFWTEFSTCQSTNLKRRWLDLFCNYYHIQCVCNLSIALVVILCCNLSFSHIFGTSKILSLTWTLCL
jgi:hypothetical protein